MLETEARKKRAMADLFARYANAPSRMEARSNQSSTAFARFARSYRIETSVQKHH